MRVICEVAIKIFEIIILFSEKREDGGSSVNELPLFLEKKNEESNEVAGCSCQRDRP